MKWLILTTANLPEAYIMGRFLLQKNQEVSLFNFNGQSIARNLNVIKRLLKRRGSLYVADLMAGRFFKKILLRPAEPIFPEITVSAIADVQKQSHYVELETPFCHEALERTQAVNPDYILFLGAPVIKPELFSIAQRAAINWHHGISPEYRGSDCVIWAMANNEFDKIGYTIHQVTEVVDGGSILLQRRIPVRADAGFNEAYADIARQGMNAFLDVIQAILDGHEPPAQKQASGGKHYPPAGFTAFRRAKRNFKRYSEQHRGQSGA